MAKESSQKYIARNRAPRVLYTSKQHTGLIFGQWLCWITLGSVGTVGTAFGGACITYRTDAQVCICSDGRDFMLSGNYAVGSFPFDGTLISPQPDLSQKPGICSSASDTSCTEPSPLALANGDTLFLKNRTVDNDYFKCEVTLGQPLQAVRYTPSVPENTAPNITSTAPTNATEDIEYTYLPAANDAEGDTLTWTVSNEPTGMTINASTGAISWTPSQGVSTSGTVTLTVTDNGEGTLTDTETFIVEVIAANHPPSSMDDSYTTRQNTALSVPPALGVLANDSDQDGDSLTAVDFSSVMVGATLNAQPDGSFEYTPASGFSGNDTFTYKANDGAANSTPATVTLTITATVPSCRGVPATIIGTAGNDTLIGTSGDDVIIGRAGNDTIKGKSGNDLICGGKGKDVIQGGKGKDTLYGGLGDDTLHGNQGDDELHGGKGKDELRGGKGEDIIRGNKGNDELYGGKGDDELRGGLGNNDICHDHFGVNVIQGCEQVDAN